MRAFHFLTALAAVAAITTSAQGKERVNAAGEAKLAKMLDGRVAGKPVDCVWLTSIRNSEIVDGTAIVYTGNDGTLYVNRPSGANFLDDNAYLVSEPRNGQTCHIDIVRLVDRGSNFPSGSVGLNEFVPYPKVPKPKG